MKSISQANLKSVGGTFQENMDKTILYIIITAILVSGFLFFGWMFSDKAALGAPANVTLCPPKGCQTFQYDPEYLQEKGRLIGKVESGQPLTYDEYQFLISIYNYEAQVRGGLTLTDANLDGRGFMAKLNAAIMK